MSNTKQDLRDAAENLRELIINGHDQVHEALAQLCATLCAEMDRQIEFDAKRAAATVPPTPAELGAAVPAKPLG